MFLLNLLLWDSVLATCFLMGTSELLLRKENEERKDRDRTRDLQIFSLTAQLSYPRFVSMHH